MRKQTRSQNHSKLMEETEKKLKSMGSLSSSIAPSLFTPGLKPSFSANPSHRSLLFFFRTDCAESPDFYRYF